MDYQWLCSSPTNNAFEIDVATFDDLIEDDNTVVVDVREKTEHPFVTEFNHVQIPLSELMNHQLLIEKNNVVVFCQTGKRSLQAVKLLNEIFTDKNIYSLKGGIIEWEKSTQAHLK